MTTGQKATGQRARGKRRPSHAASKARQSAFLGAYKALGNISAAAEIAEIDRRTHYAWLEKSEQYRSDFEAAHAIAMDALETEARRRAVDGWEEPVFYQGQPAGFWLDENGKPLGPGELDRAVSFRPYGIRKYSDQLLITLLKGNRPEKFRERYEHSGPDGEPLQSNVVVLLPDNGRAKDA